ncbi:hypothetical protein [Paenibacillus sp. XY044]|uniref:hypothetical protein n=1 Tax=Paenibacillus sp. XY044 TaxID=2026089 RepID=UPI000B98BDD4|nr:hypothetical protein [Paenibacillus sp. XY044]OZB96186.1 hypothetical protein CJP46_09755 [Paenibacillus sp. XY044]
MKFINLLLTLVVVSVLTSSCTQHHKSSILGVWEADQATQQVGSDEELGYYNHLEITETHIRATSFNMVAIEGGDTQKKFNERERNMNYAWKAENKILVEDALFDIEFMKKEMILKNDHIEIHFNKQK